MEREPSPLCHISPPHLIPATVSLNNNPLSKWKAICTPAPTSGDLCLLQNKRLLDTWEGSNANKFHSVKWVQFAFLLFSFGYLCPSQIKTETMEEKQSESHLQIGVITGNLLTQYGIWVYFLLYRLPLIYHFTSLSKVLEILQSVGWPTINNLRNTSN